LVKATIIWLNYNSSRFINIVFRSLDSVFNIDYDNYEVIVVDNASNDGSFEKIKNYVEKCKHSGIRVKILRSDVNRGYSGGMNLGWNVRDLDSKYVVFINNDVVVEPDSLRKIIEYMESSHRIGAANGLLYLGDRKRINTAGNYISEDWSLGCICNNVFKYECPGVDKLHYITYPTGAYMVVKAEIIKKVFPEGKPFIDSTFLYLDDDLVGLTLWNYGYKVAYIPIEAGMHFENLTLKRMSKIALYYATRAQIARINIIRTRFYTSRYIYVIAATIRYILINVLSGRNVFVSPIRVVNDGLKLSELIKHKIGVLDLYKAPFVPVNTINSWNRLITRHILRISKIQSLVTFDMLRRIE
jgi:GT2 family glycosyltransferase